MLGGNVERPMIVDGDYDKQILDIEGPELLEEVGEFDESVEQTLQDAYGDEGEDERTGDDPYGGMPLELYENIVEFKRTGSYPPNIGVRHDRSALSHWRARCLRFILADDNETLLYYNPSSSVNDQPKVVVKKGEVRRVIERIHDLIGHLGQKRTQIVVLKKLHWRSVRQDVKTFINSCAFCNQKKLEGKKILKAPVDVTSDNFDINVEVRNKTLANGEIYDRFNFTLIGYNEQEVRAAAVTRMTSYTFKETASELRGRFSRPGSEPGFIEVFHDERDPTLSSAYSGHVYPVEELAESQPVNETSDDQHNIAPSMSRVQTKTEVGTITSSQIPSSSKREHIITPRLATFSGGRQKKASKTLSNLGLATRFSLAMGENTDRTVFLCLNIHIATFANLLNHPFSLSLSQLSEIFLSDGLQINQPDLSEHSEVRVSTRILRTARFALCGG
ncbi:hypothetical protein ANCCEY_08423 [Ancylostoma ceylanicum]|uniref:Integrase zinc-binding domain-containing protein n=1 Tax=Ancylostoma ceylanicum TaxID=53326 RepID=A0A0D6LXY6_9BILA|nr:hypothetical protein ANCCEY_08423 [Ancylostoma ceylanicum]